MTQMGVVMMGKEAILRDRQENAIRPLALAALILTRRRKLLRQWIPSRATQLRSRRRAIVFRPARPRKSIQLAL